MGWTKSLDHSQAGPVIIIMPQYEYHGKGKTVYSSVNLEWYNNGVNDKSRKVNGGDKRILPHEGYILPLHFSQGFPYLPMYWLKVVGNLQKYHKSWDCLTRILGR